VNMPNANTGLRAHIRRMYLFGTQVGFPKAQTDPPFSGYVGQPLFISKVSIDANNDLVVQIDDTGPPNAAAPDISQNRPANIHATLKLTRGTVQTSDIAPLPKTYAGGVLELTATMGMDDDLHTPLVTLSVHAWALPNDQKEYLSFMIVTVPTGQEMRWFHACVQADHPSTAHTIPPVVGGVMGPWGVETP